MTGRSQAMQLLYYIIIVSSELQVQLESLMSSYLKNRKQYVVYDTIRSEYSEVYTGVP